jgi:phenylacetate-coenzyme A ligase PaaK-like adenylate-forming protein
MALTTSCRLGHGMHVQADWAALEVVDRHNQPVKPGTPGEKVLVTNFYNSVQPFIRYEIPDVVTISPTPCTCGSPFPLVLKVEGRADQVVWIRAGDGYRQVHPYVFVDVLDERPEVGYYQIEQLERNRFSLRAAPAPGRQLDREQLVQAMQHGLAQHDLAGLIQLDVMIDNAIAPDPRSGKLLRIKSGLGPP